MGARFIEPILYWRNPCFKFSGAQIRLCQRSIRSESMATFTTRSFVAIALLILLSSCTSVPPQPPQLQPLALDKEGWTRFSPSADSRIIYVSDSDGDDATGKVYGQSDRAVSADPRNPSRDIKPFKTFSAAFKHTRDGYPDWILLKRGDTFYGSVATRNGRSDNEPFL